MVACRQSSHDRSNGRSPDNASSTAQPRMDRAPIRRKGGIDCRPSVLALTEDSQIVETVRVCADEDAGMHLAVS